MESAINLLAYARSSRKAFTMHKTQQSLEGVEAALKIIMNEGSESRSPDEHAEIETWIKTCTFQCIHDEINGLEAK